MNRLIIVGSPRIDGRCAQLADLLFESCIDECPEDELALAPVSTLNIEGCRGCDGCRSLAAKRAEALESRGEGPDEQQDDLPARCVIADDMVEVYDFIDAADELIVVAPVYFAGPPAQLKALIDRLQPLFWSEARKAPKRPATLHVVGEGGDPHGFSPLVGIVRSALSCSGFELERVLDWVGKIDENGEITAEAVEYPIMPLPGVAVGKHEGTACVAAAAQRCTPEEAEAAGFFAVHEQGSSPEGHAAPRPKLKLDQLDGKGAASKQEGWSCAQGAASQQESKSGHQGERGNGQGKPGQQKNRSGQGGSGQQKNRGKQGSSQRSGAGSQGGRNAKGKGGKRRG